MKKLLLIPVLILGMSLQVNAQKSFQKGNVLLNPGVGIGSNYGAFYGGFRPSVFFAADFGVHDYVSVGPYVGSTFFRNATGIDFGARGNFHWWQLLDDKVNADLKQSQLDIYATLWMGGELFVFDSGSTTGGFDIGFTQGVRWYPKSNKRFALFAEFGYTPISYATIGATIKIGK
jgi:hypothetical protein